MKRNYTIAGWLMLLALSTLNLQPSTAHAQTTAFSYQGQLQNNGSPANGLYDLRFEVWDALTSGNLIAGPLTNSATGVTNGLFTVTLDFGPGVFTGPGRWLELDVRTNGNGTFTTLLPLQQILPMPYSIMANTASNLLGTLPASQLSGTLANGTLPASPNFSGTVTADAFSGNGAGLTALNASQLTSGTLPLARLPGAVITNNETTVTLGNVTVNGNLNLPATATFSSGGSSLLAGLSIDPTSQNSGSVGANALVFGAPLGSSGEGIVSKRGGTPDLEFFTDWGNRMTILHGGNVGINTANPAATLDVNGNLNVEGNATLSGNLNLPSPAIIYSGGNPLLLADGQNNTGVGDSVLASITSGSWNTACGYLALSDNTSGHDNTANGWAALFHNIGNSGNTANGSKALFNNNNGNYNTASGFQALQSNTSGNNNTADGVNALSANTTASGNVAVGYVAMGNNTIGSNSVAVGYEALLNNISGNQNTANGYNALYNNTDGGGNTASGYNSLYNNTSGYNNTVAGSQALANNSSGFDNVGVGVSTFFNNSAGSQNTAVGTYAFQNLTSGNGNVGLGYYAGNSLTSGDNNIYIGNVGHSQDEGVIRIGDPAVQTTTTCIAGIWGTILPNSSGVPVYIDANGHLGTGGAASGTFTPTIGDGTHNFTTSQATGYYEQMGNLVFVEIWIKWTGKGSATAASGVQVSLPFPVVSARPTCSLGYNSGFTFGSQLTASSVAGWSYLELDSLSNTGGSASNVTVANCATSGELQVSGFYRYQ